MNREDIPVYRRTSHEAKNLWAGYNGSVTASLRFKEEPSQENNEKNKFVKFADENKNLLPYQRQGKPTFGHRPTMVLHTSSQTRENILKHEISYQESSEEKLRLRAETAEKHVRALLRINQQMASYMHQLYTK